MKSKWRKAVCIELYDALTTIYRSEEDNTGIVTATGFFVDFVDDMAHTRQSIPLNNFLSSNKSLSVQDIYAIVDGDILYFALLLNGNNGKQFVRKYTYHGAFSIEWETGKGYIQ